MRILISCALWTAMSLSSTFTAFSQTVVWSIPPSDYNEITCIGENLYKVVSNGNVGLVYSDGTVVLESAKNEIGRFYESKALVTRMDDKGELVVGCLADKGKFHKFSRKYYTLNGQKFYSDDLLSVADENGKLGYVDYQGNAVLGFNGRYSKIKPFVEGYAAVFKNKKYALINKEGDEVRFSFSSVGEVYGGTNVCNGLAYVWDTEGTFYTYNTLTKGHCKKIKTPKNLSFDYLYRFSVVSGKSKTVPFEETVYYNGRRGMKATLQNGLYGYVALGGTVVPGQFSSATTFQDDYAVVGLNGKLGLLRYIADDSFGVELPTGQSYFYAGNAVTCSLKIKTPEVWSGKSLDVSLKDAAGNYVPVNKVGDAYTFVVHPASTCQKKYSVTISGEDITLFETDATYSFIKKEKCPTCGKDKLQCPYSGKHPTTKTIVVPPKQEKKCPDCGKKISECPYRGVH